MLFDALHFDPLAAIAQHIAHCFFRRHQAALLIDDHPVQRFGQADMADIGGKLTGQQLEKRRFARAIFADNANAVAARYPQRQVVDDRAVAEFLGHALGINYRLGAHIVIADGQIGGPLRPHHRRTRGAHFLQLGQPPLVAPPPPGHPAQQPMLLQLQLGVEPFGIAGFFGINGLGPRFEPAKTHFGTADCAPIKP